MTQKLESATYLVTDVSQNTTAQNIGLHCIPMEEYWATIGGPIKWEGWEGESCLTVIVWQEELTEGQKTSLTYRYGLGWLGEEEIDHEIQYGWQEEVWIVGLLSQHWRGPNVSLSTDVSRWGLFIPSTDMWYIFPSLGWSDSWPL